MDWGGCKADAPFMPLLIGGLAGVALEKSEDASGFPFNHGPFVCGLFRDAVFGQLVWSPATGMELPLGWAFEVTVDVDEFDDVDDTEDEELVRWRVFRDMNMFIPLTSSELDAFDICPPLVHPGRLKLAKLGRLATAVMRKT